MPVAQMIAYNGRSLSIRGWARRCRVAHVTMMWRLRHWPLAAALTRRKHRV